MNEFERLKYIINKRGVIKLFTIRKGITAKLLSQLTKFGEPEYDWVNDPAQADYFAFPSNYEVGHELTHYYLHYFDGNPYDKEISLQHEAAIMQLAKQFNKKIIIVYFSDVADEIKIDNSIIFRTSLNKSAGRTNEIAMPVIKNNLSLAQNNYTEYIEWNEKPAIGFRGIAAPEKFNKLTRTWRNQVNLLANRYNMDDIFNLKKNFGYLERRNAVRILQRNKNIETDFTITGDKEADDSHSRNLFIDTVFKNPYTLCVSGFGNYSYRFYETLSAGRIPVFIDTDCKLPFEEFINWKNHVVWVEKKYIYCIDKILLDFHRQHKNDFKVIQQSNKKFWEEFLSPQQYFINIKAYL